MLRKIASKFNIPVSSLKVFVENTVLMSAIDQETLSGITRSLGLNWKERSKLEKEIVRDLIPVFSSKTQKPIYGLELYFKDQHNPINKDKFSVQLIGEFNPFEWSDLVCPFCRKPHAKFVSLSHSGVFCDKCNAKFEVRYTSGDPGCVVVGYIHEDDIIADLWECQECGHLETFMDWQDPTCPKCGSHIFEKAGGEELWEPGKDSARRYTLILKTDPPYCSGWMGDGWLDNFEWKLDFPTQEQWENFLKMKGDK